MKNKIPNSFSFILAVVIYAGLIMSCDKITELVGEGGDRLYFCESYIPSTDKCEGKSDKYTTGALTVMVKLTKNIGVSKVDINITDLASNSVVNTIPFDVNSSHDYIYFEGVSFESTGTYRVSCLKQDGTVIASNTVEIISR
jgi:hypothetical protein